MRRNSTTEAGPSAPRAAPYRRAAVHLRDDLRDGRVREPVHVRRDYPHKLHAHHHQLLPPQPRHLRPRPSHHRYVITLSLNTHLYAFNYGNSL